MRSMQHGWFEADAEAMDADPDPKLAADNMGMDVEGDREVRAGGRRDDRRRRHTVRDASHPNPLPRCEAVKMLIEQMDNDVDIPPDLTSLTDRAQRTFANANGFARQAVGAQGLGSPQIPRPGSTPSLTPLWRPRRSGSAVSPCPTRRSRQQ